MIKIREAIPVALSELLKEFTSKDDRADIISKVNGVSSSTLRDVMYRMNTVTLKNLPAVKLLILKAAENADTKIKQAKNCKKEVKKVIDCIN